MVLLTVEHLRKQFGPDPVLTDVTFQVRKGDKIGLIGPNGCGKTTLLNILVGREESEKGIIDKPSDVTLGYLEQRPEVIDGRTVLEEARTAMLSLIEMQKEMEEIGGQIGNSSDPSEHERLAKRFDHLHEELLRHDAYNLDYRIERILHGVGFSDDDFKQQVSSLSGGELNRLSLAKLLLEEPDIMLLDEPSNHLDLAATEWLEEFLKGTSAAVILVSHDRYFLDQVTNRTFELYFGTIDDYPGNFSKYLMLKEDRLLVQTRTYEKYTEEVEKAKDFIRRHHYGMKAAQAEDRRKKLERLEQEPAAPPKKIATPSMSFPEPSRTGDIVFRIDSLSKGFGTPLFRNLTLTIERGSRWAIVGPNGCGKSTFLKCLLGEILADSGHIQRGQGLKIGYFDQQLHVLQDDMLVVDAIRPEKKVFEDLDRRKLLGAFGLTGDQQLQTVESLSGGQRCRAALAKLAADDPNIMILDEPTNHLDLWARAGLEKALKNFPGTVLFISHDRYFVDKVADHLLVIQPNAQFKVIEGNYSTFRHMVSRGLIADPFLPHALDVSASPTGHNSVGGHSTSDHSAGGQKSAQKPTQKSSVSGKAKNSASVSSAASVKQGNSSSDRGKTSKNRPETKLQGNLRNSNSGNSRSLSQNQSNNQSDRTNQSSGSLKNLAPERNVSQGIHSRAQTDRQKYWSEAAFKETEGRDTDSFPQNSSKKKRVRKFPYRKVSEIEEEIFVRETQLMTLNDEFLLPSTQRNGDRAREIKKEIEEEENALKLLYEHWEEASELNW